jgi:hypothetical protein
LETSPVCIKGGKIGILVIIIKFWLEAIIIVAKTIILRLCKILIRCPP